jgi:hypothetical protein
MKYDYRITTLDRYKGRLMHYRFLILMPIVWVTACYSAVQSSIRPELVGVACKKGTVAFKRGYADDTYACAIVHTLKNDLNKNDLQAAADAFFLEAQNKKLEKFYFEEAAFPITRACSLPKDTATQVTLALLVLYKNRLKDDSIVFDQLFLNEGSLPVELGASSFYGSPRKISRKKCAAYKANELGMIPLCTKFKTPVSQSIDIVAEQLFMTPNNADGSFTVVVDIERWNLRKNSK